MTDHSAEFRRCLSECDVVAIRKLSSYIFPNIPQPSNDREALATIHYARTQSEWMELRLRAYSHRWLIDQGYPSALPDELRPRAERMHPIVVDGVGIAVKTAEPLAKLIQQAMSDAVQDAYADKQTDPSFVKERMMEARRKTIVTCLGKYSLARFG